MSRLRARCPDCRHVHRGRDRARVPVPLVRARRSPPGSCACRGPGARAARRWPRRRTCALPYPEASVVDTDTLAEQTFALAAELPERPLVLGGCCCSHVGAIEGLSARRGRSGVVWIDAHGDLNTPETSPSGQRVGDAAADGARLRRRRPAGRGARSARATSTRPRRSSSLETGSIPARTASPRRSTAPTASTSRSTSTSSSRASWRCSCPSRTGCRWHEVEEMLRGHRRDAGRRSAPASPGSGRTRQRRTGRAPRWLRSACNRPRAGRRV